MSGQAIKAWLNGETRNGLHLCGLWPTVWVPVTAASDELECVLTGCILAQHIVIG
jgi:hypothetical protein